MNRILSFRYKKTNVKFYFCSTSNYKMKTTLPSSKTWNSGILPLLIFTGFFLLSPGSFSQNTDSLKTLIAKSENDSALLRLLFETGYAEFYNYRYDSAQTYYTRALLLSEEKQNKRMRAKIHFYFGEMLLETGDFDKALEHYFTAADLYSGLNDPTGLNNAWFGAGLAYKSKGYYNAALTYYNLSLEKATEINDSVAIADIFNNMGTAEKNLGFYTEAMQHFSTALDIYKKEGNTIYEFTVLNNIGSLHEKQGSFKKALDYYEKSLELARGSGDKFYLFAPLTNCASMYSTLGENEKSLDLFNEALELARQINDNVRIVDCYNELGNLMFKTRQIQKAKDYYETALTISEKSNNNPAKTEALINISKLAIEQKNYTLAAQTAENALKLAEETKANPLISEVYRILYQIHVATGNLKEALTCLQNSNSINDSIFSIEKTRAIEELEIKYQVKTKLEENDRLKAEATSMHQILIQKKRLSGLLLTGIVLLVFIAVLLIRQIKISKKLREKENVLHLQKMENLGEKIEHQKRELVSKSIYITEKNTSIQRIIEQLENVSKEPADAYTKQNHLKEIIQGLKFELHNQNHWDEFETHFNSVHPGFYKNLNKSYPELTVSERKLCAFLKLKLSSKNISSITGQSLKSIEVARSRLRKKMNLKSNDNFFDLLERI